MSKSKPIKLSKGEANDLISKYGGKKIESLSVGPAEVYELTNDGALVFFSFEKKVDYYPNKFDVIPDHQRDDIWLANKTPFSLPEVYFPAIFGEMDNLYFEKNSIQINLETNTKRLDAFLNKSILFERIPEQFRRGMVFIGELIKQRRSLQWSTSEMFDVLLKENIYLPYLYNPLNGKKYDDAFIKSLSEWYTGDREHIYLSRFLC
jgi:hypothetical protein